jgi:hypothetical protein
MNKNERFTTTIWAPLVQIRISDRRRRCISQATVERYREWLEQGREAPPVHLARQGEVYVVRDGRHRIAAALAAGHTVVEAVLQRMTEMLGLICRHPSISFERWGRSSDGRVPRLHRGGAGSTPAVSADHSPLWGRSMRFGDCTRPGLMRYGGKTRVRIPSGSIFASVVSTASTRPLYGRGAGSTPAGRTTSRT